MLCFDTISEFAQGCVCGEPNPDELVSVYSLKYGEEVFEGSWYDLLKSPYADIPIASVDIGGGAKHLIGFNLDDEDWEYEDMEDKK